MTSFLLLSGMIILGNVRLTSTVSENYVRLFLQKYNYYMAVLKRLSVEITWELELGKSSGGQRKKALIIANKAARYIRVMNAKAEKLYEAVKKAENKISDDLKRQLMLINQVGTPKNLNDIVMTNKVLKLMSKIYSSARVC